METGELVSNSIFISLQSSAGDLLNDKSCRPMGQPRAMRGIRLEAGNRSVAGEHQLFLPGAVLAVVHQSDEQQIVQWTTDHRRDYLLPRWQPPRGGAGIVLSGLGRSFSCSAVWRLKDIPVTTLRKTQSIKPLSGILIHLQFLQVGGKVPVRDQSYTSSEACAI